ncbi:MAG: hypothetical protein Q7J73_09020 [Dehalococcoidales bacterium]|nr:hypothetical protein [Dehalococcoidales bacterium]
MHSCKKEFELAISLIYLSLTLLIITTGCAKSGNIKSNQITETPNTSTSQPKSFEGTLSGNWSGQLMAETAPVSLSGGFVVTISADGKVQGSFDGTYSGTATGQVDVDGNLTATGLATGGTTVYPTVWQGKLSSSGNSMFVQGTLVGPYLNGVFSGSGVAHR